LAHVEALAEGGEDSEQDSPSWELRIKTSLHQRFLLN